MSTGCLAKSKLIFPKRYTVPDYPIVMLTSGPAGDQVLTQPSHELCPRPPYLQRHLQLPIQRPGPLTLRRYQGPHLQAKKKTHFDL
jgi:hypothetical protein